MSIKSISIRNFRSIASLSESVSDLNIFVGQNDEGKSNILRALDLFFNHAAGGYHFDWIRDYCSFALKRVRKAEEIEITVVVEPPPSFNNRNPVSWKKIWRRGGLYHEALTHEDRTPIDPKSKVAAFVKAMRFDYVPAIKGSDYFQALMSKLHDMLEATVEERVRQASGAFTASINANTQPILDEVRTRLGLETTIQLPSNLRSLFAQLEFTSISANKPFSLNQRGDGIKVRHIPIVLRWLAEQANHLSAPGRPKAVTIWGYEEPENNLELRRCFELAKELVDGASEIQSFVTTHSPAFYSIFRDCDQTKVALFLVTKGDPEPTSSLVRVTGDSEITSLDSSMGLFDLLEPHFRKARQELARLRKAEKKLTNTAKATIFCEGPTDKMILVEALSLFYPTKVAEVAVRCSSSQGGGHTWVGDMMIAWSHLRPSAKAVGLFDKDAAAQTTRGQVEQRIKNPQSGKKVFSLTLAPTPELLACIKRQFLVPFAIEELLPEDVWNTAETRGWLDNRKNPMALYQFTDPGITFTKYVRKTFPEGHLQRLVLRKVALQKKEAFARYVVKTGSPADRKRTLDGVHATLEKALQVLDVT